LEHLEFVSLLTVTEVNDGSCDGIRMVLKGVSRIRMSVPFREYMIQRRKPLSVNAKGTTNMRRTSAEVDSRESSTMPTE
jgi:hypothetical protein